MLDRVADVLRDLLLATPPNVGGGVATRRAARRVEGGEALPRARPRRPARRARPLHQERRRRARPLVRVGADQGRVRLRRGRRQLREPVHAGLRLRAAAPRVRRGERQARAVGPRARRHGRDHAGDGARVRGARRDAAHRARRSRASSSRAAAPPASSSTSGEVVAATRVVANVNPKLLFERLVAPEHLPTPISARASPRYRCGSGTFRMNVALSELPDFTCAARDAPRSRITPAASSSRRRSRTWSARTSTRRTDGWSRAPIVEVLIPSVVDDSLAPPGMHVASLFCQHVHPDLPRCAGPDLGRRARRGRRPDDRHGRRASRRTSARACSAGARCRRSTSSASSGSSAATSSTARCRSTSCSRARPVLGHGNYRMPVAGPLPVRLRHASRRRRHRRARAQRGARDPARRAPAPLSGADGEHVGAPVAREPATSCRGCRRIKSKSADKPGSVTARLRAL